MSATTNMLIMVFFILLIDIISIVYNIALEYFFLYHFGLLLIPSINTNVDYFVTNLKMKMNFLVSSSNIITSLLKYSIFLLLEVLYFLSRQKTSKNIHFML